MYSGNPVSVGSRSAELVTWESHRVSDHANSNLNASKGSGMGVLGSATKPVRDKHRNPHVV